MSEGCILSSHLSQYIFWPVPGFEPMSSVFLGEHVTHLATLVNK